MHLSNGRDTLSAVLRDGFRHLVDLGVPPQLDSALKKEWIQTEGRQSLTTG